MNIYYFWDYYNLNILTMENFEITSAQLVIIFLFMDYVLLLTAVSFGIWLATAVTALLIPSILICVKQWENWNNNKNK